MFGALSPWHAILLGIVVLVLFGGGGKISSLMGDFAKGIKSFKKHMADDEAAPPEVGTVQVTPPSVEQHSEELQKQAQYARDEKMVDEVKPPSSH